MTQYCISFVFKSTKTILSILAVYVTSHNLSAQNIVVSTTTNTACNGLPCDWDGPSILINEIMVSPSSGDGTLSGEFNGGSGKGEWIELYNPDVCNPVDISCYYLGNFTNDGGDSPGGFRLPDNLIVPPAGFVLVRGSLAPPVPANLLVANGGNTIEIVVPPNINNTGVCVGGVGERLWFPNAGGWFAFYNENGVVQDAIRWGQSNTASLNGQPCVASRPGCATSMSLLSYNQIPATNKSHASTADASIHIGQSVRRLPDGGNWSGFAPPTYGTCNTTCFDPGVSSCLGTATVVSAPGIAPYSYLWNDPDNQTTQTAIGLCAATYSVTVTSANGIVSTINVTIQDFVPTINFNWQESFCLNEPPTTIQNVSPIAGNNELGIFSGPGITQNQFNPSAAGVGTHTVTYSYTDVNGCQNSDSVEVQIYGIPEIEISNDQEQYCITDSITQYIFSPNDGFLYGPATNGSQFLPYLNNPGNYNLYYVYVDENNCSDTLNFDVEVMPLPSVNILTPPIYCIFDEPSIINTTPQVGDSLTLNGISTNIINPNQLGIGVHELYFSYTSEIGCFNEISRLLYVAPNPEILLSLEPLEGCPPLTQTFFGESVNGGFCTWDFGNGNTQNGCSPITETYNQTGCYSPIYNVSNEFGCTADTTLTDLICVYVVPEAQFYYTPSPLTIFNNTANFINTSNNGVIYHWEFNVNNDLISTNEIDFSFTFPEGIATLYPVTLWTESMDGCIDSVTYDVIVNPDINIYVPNTFTPDNDKFNDEWFVFLNGIDIYDFELIVFNRWGEVVWESRNPNEGWNGTYNGKPVPEGTYIWQISAKQLFIDKRYVWRGHLNVLS